MCRVLEHSDGVYYSNQPKTVEILWYERTQRATSDEISKAESHEATRTGKGKTDETFNRYAAVRCDTRYLVHHRDIDIQCSA